MTAVTKQGGAAALTAVLGDHTKHYASLLPKGYEPSRLITSALVAISQTPELMKCEHRSIALALAKVAQWGLDVGDTAYLIPFKGKAVAVVGFKGLIQLMVGSAVRKVEAHVVREGEPFEYQRGTGEFLRHSPRSYERGKEPPITHAYAIVTLKFGYQQFEVMSAAEIEDIRQRFSVQWKSGPLPAWYARKTLIRRVAKYVPQSDRLKSALETDAEFAEEPEVPETSYTVDTETGEVMDTDAPSAVVDGDEEYPL